jgi:hypothetical protein
MKKLNLRPLTLSNNLLNLQNLHNNEQPKAYVLQVPSNLCPSHSYQKVAPTLQAIESHATHSQVLNSTPPSNSTCHPYQVE